LVYTKQMSTPAQSSSPGEHPPPEKSRPTPRALSIEFHDRLHALILTQLGASLHWILQSDEEFKGLERPTQDEIVDHFLENTAVTRETWGFQEITIGVPRHDEVDAQASKTPLFLLLQAVNGSCWHLGYVQMWWNVLHTSDTTQLLEDIRQEIGKTSCSVLARHAIRMRILREWLVKHHPNVRFELQSLYKILPAHITSYGTDSLPSDASWTPQ